MAVETHYISLHTDGNGHILDLTGEIISILSQSSINNGTATVFVVGSTGAITTTEYEPGLVNTDFKVMLEKVAPEDGYYAHEETWHDDNGHSHVRASLMGPSLTVPLVNGRLTLGTWQQVVLMDFDTRPRDREVVLQLIGE